MENKKVVAELLIDVYFWSCENNRIDYTVDSCSFKMIPNIYNIKFTSRYTKINDYSLMWFSVKCVFNDF